MAPPSMRAAHGHCVAPVSRSGSALKLRPPMIPPRRLSRRVVVLAALAAPAALPAQAAPCAPPTVLFVCPAGTVKSAIARETLKRRAAASGVRVRVVSRGVHPEDHVSPALAANLRADGIDPAAEPVLALQDA